MLVMMPMQEENKQAALITHTHNKQQIATHSKQRAMQSKTHQQKVR